jgi:hypothetical protein
MVYSWASMVESRVDSTLSNRIELAKVMIVNEIKASIKEKPEDNFLLITGECLVCESIASDLLMR